jgi:outer membrane protein assembly factor BamB
VFTNEGDELAAFDLATGHRRWRLAVPGPVYGEWDTPSGLVAVIDEVGPHAEVIGVDRASGRIRWRDPFPKGLYADQYPTSDGGLVLLSSSGSLSVIDDTDGRSRWRLPGPVQGVVPLALGDGLVIRNTGTSFTAYDLRSGSVRWQAPANPRSAPLVVGHTVVETAAASPDPEHLTGSDLATGRQLWQLDQTVDTGTGGRFATGVGIVTTPASGAGGTLTLSDPGTGRADWSIPANPAVIDVDPQVVGAELVTIEGGTVAEPALHAVWRRVPNGGVDASVLLPISSASGAVVDANEDVIVRGGSPSGESLVAVGRRVLWQAPLPEVAQRDPVPLADGGAVVQVESPPRACGLSGSRPAG